MAKENKPILYPILSGFKQVLFDGMAVVVPITITTLVLVWAFKLVDGVLQPIIEALYGKPVTGLGFVAIIELMLLAGLIYNTTLGCRMLGLLDSLLAKVPIFSSIYFAVKPIVENIIGAGLSKGAFRQVVFVEWPSKGMKTIAFVTKEQTNSKGQRLYSVYIPTSPTPQSGFYMIAHEKQVYHTDICIDEAMKMVISAGIISPGIIDIDKPVTARLLSPKKRTRAITAKTKKPL